MAKQEIISGQKSVWQLIRKTGEGDAGEIYEVASLSGARTAFLKRPVMSAFRGDIFRQSSQIRNEARVISALGAAQGFDERMRVAVPRLLDQSKPGPEYNEGNFIIIEKAEGLDLGLLARAARKGLAEREEESLTASPEGRALLLEIAREGKIPDLLLADLLMRLAHYLDFIHHLPARENGKLTQGIVWNDVKPDHLFWDPAGGTLTIIDWGNARFLETDQTTVNHQFAWMDDFRQFFDEMGKYLNENAPALLETIGWAEFTREKTYPPRRIEEIKTRLAVLYRTLSQAGQSHVPEEGTSKADALPVFQISAADIQTIRDQISEYGADLEGRSDGRDSQYIPLFAGKLLAERRLEDLCKLAHWAGSLAGDQPSLWQAVELISGLGLQAGEAEFPYWSKMLENAFAGEWEDVLWRAADAAGDGPLPSWWPELTLSVRRLALGEDQGSVRPLEGVWRVYYTLQAQVLAQPEGEGDAEVARQLMKQLTGEVVPNWTMREPTPPDSRLDYRPALQAVTEALALLPEKDQAMAGIFTPAAAQIEKVLAAWEKKDFHRAAASLRRALLLDPDRRRALNADRLIHAAEGWLRTVEAGPNPEEDFSGWLANVEFTASDLRSQVGPTAWLERILKGCRSMQAELWPSDLAASSPDLLTELPWLTNFDRREKAMAREPREKTPAGSVPTLEGKSEARIGLNEAVALIGPLDAWAPEARGSSARVVSGLFQTGPAAVTAAVKLMRMDQVQYALPLFREEAVILARLGDVPGVAKLVECGFFKLDEGSEFPLSPGYGHPPAEGKALRLGIDSVEEYVHTLEERITDGWTPYLAVEKQEQEESLLFLCDAGQTRGQYQPTVTLLKMAVQISDVLEQAHARGIVYRDHKILHYYWNGPDNRLTMIDWNVARYHPEGLRPTDVEMDIVQFGARGLHHILTGRTAPGALPLGPTRPEEIEAAAHTYKTHWTYDDGRLSQELRELLERVLAGGYTSVAELRDDLKKTLIARPSPNTIPA